MDSDFIQKREAEFDQLTVEEKFRFSKSIQEAFDNGAQINEAEKLRGCALEWIEANRKAAKQNHFTAIVLALVFIGAEFFGFKFLPSEIAWFMVLLGFIFGVRNEIFAHMSQIQKTKTEATLGYLRQRPHLRYDRPYLDYSGDYGEYSEDDKRSDAHTLRKLLFGAKTEIQWHEFDFLCPPDDID